MSTASRHRVGLVGAGHISAFHLAALRRIANVDVVGIHDLDQDRAAALAGPLGIPVAASVDALFEAGATSIHVLTPPHTHAAVALAAIDRGCHVFVEKPLATDLADAERVRDAAQAAGVSVGVGHSLLYDPQVRQALLDVRAGALGELVSVDILRSSVYPPYAGGPLPPQYRTAGYPFRDLGVHALYLMEAFLGPIEDVQASWTSLGGDSNLAFDEWRAVVRCHRGMGQFQLSWNVKPLQHQIVLQGTKGVRRVDLFLMFQSERRGLPLPKAAERIVNALTDSIQPLIDVPRNVLAFARGKVRQYHGVQDLVAAFYAAIDAGQPSPVGIDSGVSAVRWTEEVARAADRDFETRRARATLTVAPDLDRRPVLVTGGLGGLGSALVERLRAEGEAVRLLVRRAPDRPLPGVDVVIGDLGDPEAVDRAVRGTRVVFHLGAAMKGGWPAHQCATIQGTRNVVEACLGHGVDKLVHTSSLSVVHWADGPDFAIVDEDVGLEPRPEERGSYTRSKLEAEQIVATAARNRGLPAVILRPGQIFGGKLPLMTPAIARRMGERWLVLGDGRIPLPLVYIDDVVDALWLAAQGTLRAGEIVQVVDPESLTQNDVLDLVSSGTPVLRVPRGIVFAGGKLSELALGAIGKKSPLSEYRLRSALALRRFEAGRAERLLGWQPRVGVREGIRRSQERKAA